MFKGRWYVEIVAHGNRCSLPNSQVVTGADLQQSGAEPQSSQAAVSQCNASRQALQVLIDVKRIYQSQLTFTVWFLRGSIHEIQHLKSQSSLNCLLFVGLAVTPLGTFDGFPGGVRGGTDRLLERICT